MRLFGHPIHPMLVHFPLAFLTMASVGDICVLFGWDGPIPYILPLLGTGILFAMPTMVAGFVDYVQMAKTATDNAQTMAQRHMLLMGLAWTLYVFSLILRVSENGGGDTGLIPVLLTFLGLIVLSAGAHYGGELVFRYGVGKVIGKSQTD